MQAVGKEMWYRAIAAEDKGWDFDDPEAYARHEHGIHHGQITYARLLGLFDDFGRLDSRGRFHQYTWPAFDLGGRSVVDVAGGPCSLLLRCTGFRRAVVVDPGAFPGWVVSRYVAHGIEVLPVPAEEYAYPQRADEVWFYNALAHVFDPFLILRQALRNCKTLRLVEVLDAGTDAQHPQNLTEGGLASVLGEGGRVVDGDDPAPAPRGRLFCGVFEGGQS